MSRSFAGLTNIYAQSAMARAAAVTGAVMVLVPCAAMSTSGIKPCHAMPYYAHINTAAKIGKKLKQELFKYKSKKGFV